MFVNRPQVPLPQDLPVSAAVSPGFPPHHLPSIAITDINREHCDSTQTASSSVLSFLPLFPTANPKFPGHLSKPREISQLIQLAGSKAQLPLITYGLPSVLMGDNI